MEIKEGYVYHIKKEFFDLANDDMLMKNHDGNATRPQFCNLQYLKCKFCTLNIDFIITSSINNLLFLCYK